MAELKIMPPTCQKTWGRPAVVNMALGGAGAGLYLIHSLFSSVEVSLRNEVQLIPYQIAASALTAIGFIAVSIEAGRPLRAYRLIGKLSSSWMSIESLAGGAFIIVSLLDWLYPNLIFKILGIPVAFFFLISQGMVLYRALSVTTWSNWVIPPFFITSGLMSAAGLSFLNARSPGISTALIPFFSLCTLFNLTAWLCYLFCHSSSDYRHAVKVIRTPVMLLLIVGAGHVIPILMAMFIPLLQGTHSASFSISLLWILCGLLMFSAVAWQKSAIILKASHRRSITIV